MIPATVSLFSGAGGESVGKHLALEELGIPSREIPSHAINHWDLAVATHGRNLPWISVHQEDITKVSAKTYGLKGSWPSGTVFEFDDESDGVGSRVRLKDRAGSDPAEWPADLRVREFPKGETSQSSERPCLACGTVGIGFGYCAECQKSGKADQFARGIRSQP